MRTAVPSACRERAPDRASTVPGTTFDHKLPIVEPTRALLNGFAPMSYRPHAAEAPCVRGSARINSPIFGHTGPVVRHLGGSACMGTHVLANAHGFSVQGMNFSGKTAPKTPHFGPLTMAFGRR